MALWLMALAALLTSENCKQPEPPVDGKAEMLARRVEGVRYDYEVEVGERIDRYRDAARRVVERGAASRQAFLRGLDGFAAAASLATRARTIVRETARRADALAALPNPTCSYLADGSGGEHLLPAGRALIDGLADATAPDGVRDGRGACEQAPVAGDARRQTICRGLLAPNEGACAKAIDAGACRSLFAPRADMVQPGTIRGDALLVLWAHARRAGLDLRVVTKGGPAWLEAMGAAVAARDPAACPRWIDWRSAHRGLTASDPDAPFADLDPLVSATLGEKGDTITVRWTSLFPVECRVEGRGEDGADLLHRFSLSAHPQGIGSVGIGLPRAARAPVRTTCRIAASVGHDGSGFAGD